MFIVYIVNGNFNILDLLKMIRYSNRFYKFWI